ETDARDPRDAGDRGLPPADHARRPGGGARRPKRRAVAPIDGEGLRPHRRPRRFAGPAGAVWDDEEVLAGVWAEKPARFADRSGFGTAGEMPEEGRWRGW